MLHCKQEVEAVAAAVTEIEAEMIDLQDLSQCQLALETAL